MIEQEALVICADAELATVQAVRHSACGSCHAAAGCGTSLLDRFLGRRPLRLRLRNALGVTAGEVVIIGVPEGSMLRAAASAYLGPLAGLLLGALAGRHWPLPSASVGSEWPSLVGAGIGFLLALRLVGRYGRSLAQDPRFQPVLLRRGAPTPVRVALG